MIALIHGRILMSEGPLRMDLQQCQSNISSYEQALIGELFAAYAVDPRELRLKCIASETNPNPTRPTIPPFVTR